MVKKDRTVAARLARAHLVIANALEDSFIMEAVGRFNYDGPRVREGLGMYELAARLSSEQAARLGERLSASYLFRELVKETKSFYIMHLNIARLTLKKDPSIQQMLGLEGPRKRAVGGWMEDARQFYINALSEPKIVDSLSRFGISREILQEGDNRVEELERAAADLEKKKGLAKQARKDRDQALLELEEWVRIFLKVCRYALADRPQLMEKLGIVVPSGPRKRKRKEKSEEKEQTG